MLGMGGISGQQKSHSNIACSNHPCIASWRRLSLAILISSNEAISAMRPISMRRSCCYASAETLGGSREGIKYCAYVNGCHPVRLTSDSHLPSGAPVWSSRRQPRPQTVQEITP
jgi:hypothetical protein